MYALMVMAALALAQPAPPVSPESLVDDVRKLTAAKDNDERFEAVAQMLRDRNITFTVEPFTIEKAIGTEPRTGGRNIVFSAGTGSEQIVIGAHYDAVRLTDGSLSRGAVDNAASSVTLVRLAAALRAEPPPSRVTIVWFDMEELGLLGSAKYRAAHPADRVRAMLNFDINGYGDTVVFGPPSGGDDAVLRRTFLEACAEESIDCVRFSRMPPGDDRSFGKAGVPTLSIAQLPALEAHQLWLALHAGEQSGLAPGTSPAIMHTIHTPDDVPGKVDGVSMARTYRLAAALVRRLTAAMATK